MFNKYLFQAHRAFICIRLLQYIDLYDDQITPSYMG
jgi:hypothetical protein